MASDDRLVGSMKRFEGLRGNSMNERECEAFREAFGELSDEDLDGLDVIMEDVCTQWRRTRVIDLLAALKGSRGQEGIAKRAAVSAGVGLAERVVARVGPLVCHMQEARLRSRNGIRVALLHIGDGWCCRFHDPGEPKPGWCPLVKTCISNPEFWRAVADGERPVEVLDVDPEDPWGHRESAELYVGTEGRR